jgi:hypothetical protein
MSAGKGDTPRAVNGDRYRANYEAIFAPPYPAWICRSCGDKHGRGMPERHIATWHQDTCDICGEVTACTEPRDFRHLREWPIRQ